MSEILNLANLRAYASGQQRGTQPRWPIPELLHQRVPVLAYRNYLNNDHKNQWPLCWEKRHVVPALRLVGDILRGWQAFRPSSSEKVVRALEPALPRIVLQLQKALRDHSIKYVTAVAPSSRNWEVILARMAQSVSEIARAKHVRNPMLGSKILAFFFPDFFPVWDTAWVKKALTKRGTTGLPAGVQGRLEGDKAALEYACYVHLMVSDAWNTSNKEYEKLKRYCVRECGRQGYYGSSYLVDEYFSDLTPLMFEVCLLGTLR